MTNMERVWSVYPEAVCAWEQGAAYIFVSKAEKTCVGVGSTTFGAWKDAARKLCERQPT